MSIYQSGKRFGDFFNEPGSRKYEKYRADPNAKIVFEWLKVRLDWLISSIKNHRKPALQGVIVDLEELLEKQFGWTRENKDNFFITMIGSMVRFLVAEHGFSVKRTGVLLRNNKLISTAATYQ